MREQALIERLGNCVCSHKMSFSQGQALGKESPFPWAFQENSCLIKHIYSSYLEQVELAALSLTYDWYLLSMKASFLRPFSQVNPPIHRPAIFFLIRGTTMQQLYSIKSVVCPQPKLLAVILIQTVCHPCPHPSSTHAHWDQKTHRHTLLGQIFSIFLYIHV